MSQRLILVITTIFCLWAQAGIAQDDTRWTLEECLEYAKKTNIRLKQSRLNLQTSDINLKQAKEARMPSLGGNVNYGTNLGRSVNPFTNDFENRTIRSLNAGVGGNMTLFNGFSITNTIRQSEFDQQAAQKDVEDAENTLALNVAEGYLNVLLNQDLLDGQLLQLASTEEQRDRTARLVDAGTLAPASLYEIEAQVATEQTNVVTVRNQLEFSYLQLMQLLNLDPGMEFSVEDPELSAELTAMHPAVPDEIFRFAEGTQPNIQAADLRIQSAEKQIDIARAGSIPTLGFNYNAGSGWAGSNSSLGVDRPFGEQFENNFSYGFSFGLNIPIYSRRNVRSNIERAEIQRRNAEMEADFQRQQLRQIIEQSHLDAVSAFSQYQQVKKQIESLEIAFQNAEKQFNVGLINSVDYLLAKNNLDQARLNLIRQKYTYIFRVKVLDFYQGKALGFE